MPARKLSIALDPSVADGVARAAARDGVSVSSWLNDAAENKLAIEEGLAAMRDWESEHGAFSPDELAEADAVLDRLLGAARRAG